jgi:hypothetical protein
MKALIFIKAVTQYQLQSLIRFGLPVKQNAFNYHYSAVEFNTVTEARAYFKKLAEAEYEGNPYKFKWHLNKNSLTMDALTGWILTGEEAATRKKQFNIK